MYSSLILLTILASLYGVVESELCTDSVCHYFWEVKISRSMTYRDGYRLYRVDLNDTNNKLYITENALDRWMEDENGKEVPDYSKVITADGYEMSIMTINDQFPGPTIEVMEGAQVAVHLSNNLMNDGLSIHWHGIFQQKTQWMDGVSFVTQCPIAPMQSFTYRWTANPAGVLWYHSHLNTQRTDGLHGMILVRRAPQLYPEFPVMIHDWFHDMAGETEYLGTHRLDAIVLEELIYNGGLINGRGRMNDRKFPLTVFAVDGGRKYHLHVVAAGLETSYEFSIDGHKLRIIESDAEEMTPIEVDYLHIHLGESFVVEVDTDQDLGNYWVRSDIIKVIMDETRDRPIESHRHRIRAIFRYIGADANKDPTSQPRECSQSTPCTVFNCMDPGYLTKENKRCISMSDARSPRPAEELARIYGLQDDNVIRHFFNFHFNVYTNFDGAAINTRKLVFPKRPLYQSDTDYIRCPTDGSCENGCECVLVQDIPYDRTIELVFTNFQDTILQTAENGFTYGMVHHPIHLHGYDFAVVKMGFPVMNPETGFVSSQNRDIACNNDLCSAPSWANGVPAGYNLVNPVIKNTIVVPAGGYAAVRFRSTNPGYWLIHCHIEMHVLAGMGMALAVAPEMVAPLPAGFPQCHDFEFTEEQYLQSLRFNPPTPTPSPFPQIGPFKPSRPLIGGPFSPLGGLYNNYISPMIDRFNNMFG